MIAISFDLSQNYVKRYIRNVIISCFHLRSFRLDKAFPHELELSRVREPSFRLDRGGEHELLLQKNREFHYYFMHVIG